MEQTTDSTTFENEKFCFHILSKVSQSFAVMIDKLGEPLRTTVCVFYLILRGLDTIEDDTTIDKTIKVEALKIFPTYLDHLKSRYPVGVGHGLKFSCHDSNRYYVELIDKFDIVLRVFGQCSIENKKIIRDTTDEIAEGMIKYINRPIETMADYNEYCYYASGVLGVGLTKLFHSNFIIKNVPTEDVQRLAISTGIFLQKMNIIRDIFEDITQPEERIFYPKEVWGKYVANLRDLIDENHLPKALACVNFLINDAFQQLPDSIEYISLISQQDVFRLCAIPQVIAVGTLVKMFNNPAVFNSIVKLAKTESVHIFESVTDVYSFLGITKTYLNDLSRKFLLCHSVQGTKNFISESLEFVNKYQEKLLQDKPV